MNAARMSDRRRIALAICLSLAVLILAAPFWASPLAPVAVRHASATPALHSVDVAHETIGLGLPYLEAVDVRPDGQIVFGTEAGAILEMPGTAVSGDSTPAPVGIAHLEGHSIGIAYAPQAAVYWSATFPVGLQKISPDGSVLTIDAVGGIQIAFPDDVAAGPDGIVYLTEASVRHNPVTTAHNAPYVLWDFIEGRPNGRLIAYDSDTGAASVLHDELAFPSGITLTPDGKALLIAEVTRYRVIRYELTGPDRGTVTILADGLPGIPDDVFIGPEGNVWVTLVAPRSGLLEDIVGRHPYLARIVSLLPWSWQNAMLAPAETGGSMLMLDGDGAPFCELRLSYGYPPANAVALNDRILAGRLGGQELITVNPAPCLALQASGQE